MRIRTDKCIVFYVIKLKENKKSYLPDIYTNIQHFQYNPNIIYRLPVFFWPVNDNSFKQSALFSYAIYSIYQTLTMI